VTGEGWRVQPDDEIRDRGLAEEPDWARVASDIESRLDVPARQTDTATRWLEG